MNFQVQLNKYQQFRNKPHNPFDLFRTFSRTYSTRYCVALILMSIHSAFHTMLSDNLYHVTLILIGAVVVVIVWQLNLQLPVQSVPITTNVVSSNLAHGEVYSIQHYVIHFVIDLRQVDGFLRIRRFPPPIKLHNCHDITEMLLKVALNTINQTFILISIHSAFHIN